MTIATAVLLAWPGVAAAQPQNILDPETSAAEEITDLWWFMLIVATIVVAVVTALLLLAVFRRGRADGAARRFGSIKFVGLAGAAVPAVVLAFLFGFTLETLVDISPANRQPELTIQVTGRQWFWDVRYPAREQAVTANEIHVPTGVPVRLELRTLDVLHSFWVPKLSRKVDLVPGYDNELVFEADEPGVYRGQCAEFCGDQHANMNIYVVAQPPEEFEAWLDEIAEPASPPDTRAERLGFAAFFAQGCAACHTLRGTEAQGNVGPDLTHLAMRETLAAGMIPNTRGHLGGWILGAQEIKPGNKMPSMDVPGDQLQVLLTYLESLE